MSISDTHNRFMQAAVQEAILAGQNDEVPIGAVVVHEGEIIARSGNRVERDKNPTAHAEILCLIEASKKLGAKRIPLCDLYVTLEPCTMCAGALSLARVRTLVFAASDEKGGGVLHGAKFFEQKTCHHRPDVLHLKAFEDECATLLKDFFKTKRQKP